MTSTEILGDETPADTPTADQDVTADSSPADEPSLQDAVLAALDEDTPASTEQDPKPQDEATGSETDGEDENDDSSEEADEGDKDTHELSEQEMAALNEKTRSRIGKLLDDRREARTELDTAKAEVEQLKPQAESYRQIQEFMRENEVSAKDAGTALQLAGLINTDPKTAYQSLKQLTAELGARIGATVPDDLAEDVRLGRITQERAQELAVSRADASETKRRAEAQAERQKQEQAEAEKQRRVDHVKNMSSVADRIALDRSQSDPDWKLKEPLVADKLKIHLQEKGVPKDEKELQETFDRIVTEVTTHLRSVNPGVKPSVKPSPASTSSADPKPREPKDGVDAVLIALGD